MLFILFFLHFLSLYLVFPSEETKITNLPIYTPLDY